MLENFISVIDSLFGREKNPFYFLRPSFFGLQNIVPPLMPASHFHIMCNIRLLIYSKTCVSGHSNIAKTKVLITTGSLTKVESIAECSLWSILQYF